MDVPLSPTSPAKLYAFQLKLRPLQEGTLMPFSGELVHAAWLGWLGSAAPEVASWLHEGNKRRLFTCSSLQFPIAEEHMLEGKRKISICPSIQTKPTPCASRSCSASFYRSFTTH